jgi:hypothetical protein
MRDELNVHVLSIAADKAATTSRIVCCFVNDVKVHRLYGISIIVCYLHVHLCIPLYCGRLQINYFFGATDERNFIGDGRLNFTYVIYTPNAASVNL